MGDVDIFFMVSSVYNTVGGEIRFRIKYLRIDGYDPRKAGLTERKKNVCLFFNYYIIIYLYL